MCPCCHKLPIIPIFDNLKLNLQSFEFTSFNCIYSSYLSVKCLFISDITEFLEHAKLQISALIVMAINVSRHIGVSKQKELLEKYQTGIRLGNNQDKVQRFVRV